MKAFVYEAYGSSDVLELKEVQKPTPKADELLVKVQAVSVNPKDWRLMRGEPIFVRLESGLLKPKYGILGADIAGRVEAVGANVARFKPGDEVFGDVFKGGFAEYVCATEEKFALKPVKLSFAEAAAVPLVAKTALQGVRDQGRIQAGQKVLINGASGGIGTFAVQLAKSFGAEVTGVCSSRNVDLVRSLGADHVVDYTEVDFTESDQRYDLVLDTIGNRSAADIRRILTAEGTCVIIGFTTLTNMIKSAFLGVWLSLRGGQKIVIMNEHPNQEDMTYLKDQLEAGRIRPIIDKCVPFGQTADAVAYVESGRARGKVVVTLE